MIGAITGLGAAAALGAAATPAEAQSQEAHGTPSGSRLSPRQVAAAFYASYNADLAAGFERYISKDLVLHGFDGPDERSAWVAGDLELKASLTGYRLDVFDQIAEGTKVVTRWSLGGVHTGTILGIPPSGREVHLSGISIDRVVGGQSVEHWSEGNFGRFLEILRGENA
jgi:predicted ester cyclase